MQSLNHRLIRTFVFLLATVFMINTVSAGGIMASAALNGMAGNEIAQYHFGSQHDGAHHCHNQADADKAQQHSQNQPQTQNSCSHCNHCLACVPVILQGQLKPISNPDQVILAMPFAEVYLSPTSAQPQKPPIV